MSNFKNELYRIYDGFSKSFSKLSELAKQNKVYLSVLFTPDGKIILSSNQFSFENNKEILRTHTLSYGENYLGDESKTEVLSKL